MLAWSAATAANRSGPRKATFASRPSWSRRSTRSSALNHEGRIVEFNRAAEKTFGRRREEVIGKKPEEILFASSERAQDSVERYVSAGEGSMLGKRTEITAVRASGETFPRGNGHDHRPQRGTAGVYLFLARHQRAKAGRAGPARFRGPVSVARREPAAERVSQGPQRPIHVRQRAVAAKRSASGSTRSSARPTSTCFPRSWRSSTRRDDQRDPANGPGAGRRRGAPAAGTASGSTSRSSRRPSSTSTTRVVGTQGIFWDITDRKRAGRGAARRPRKPPRPPTAPRACSWPT